MAKTAAWTRKALALKKWNCNDRQKTS